MGIKCELYDRAKTSLGRERARLSSLLRGLSELGGEDVLYVEPDAQLLRRPDVLLDERDFDVGVYDDARTLGLRGPVFVRNNRRVLPLLRDWATLNEEAPERTDLQNLSRALSRADGGLVVRRFPVTYAWVERRHRQAYPTAKPVIVHFDADGLLTAGQSPWRFRSG